MIRLIALLLQRFDRSTIIAYGGWTVLSLLLLLGTMTTLERAEYTERAALLARAEAGAATLEQTLLRVFEAVENINSLAQTRSRLVDLNNRTAAWTIEQQLRDTAVAGRFGVLQISILRPDGTLDWTSAMQGANQASSGTLSLPPPAPPASATPQDGITLSNPVLDPAVRRWVVYASRPLFDSSNLLRGVSTVALDPLVLAGMIGGPSSAPGETSLVQTPPRWCAAGPLHPCRRRPVQPRRRR